MLSFKDIAKIFEEIEVRLCAALKRAMKKRRQLESREGFEWSAWQADKLRALEQFRRENRGIMGEYTETIDAQTRQLMQEQFTEGQRQAEQGTAQVSREPPAESRSSPQFFGVNEAKMQRLMQDITTLEQRAETAALRTMDDVYRQTLNRIQLAQAAGEMPLEKAIDEAVRDFLAQGINCIVYRNGRRVNIADYVRMALRTTSARAALQGRAERFAELGYDTVLISQYGACSKTCEPWQGRVYIDDVFTVWQGESDGVRGKSNYCGEWFPLLSHAISGGLFHPNCRHTMGLYIHGVTQIPDPIPAEQIKRERELEQKQRAMERNIRRLKRLAAGTLDPEAVKGCRTKLAAAEKELSDFVNAHRDLLRREYEREKVYGGVDKYQKYGIIRSEEVKALEQAKKRDHKIFITDTAIEKVDEVKLSDFSDKQTQAMKQKHKELLELSRKNNDSDEVLFIEDLDFKSEVKILGDEFSVKPSKNPFAVSVIGNAQRQSLIYMHNHPSTNNFSVADIDTFICEGAIKTMSVVTNQGEVYALNKVDGYEYNKARELMRSVLEAFPNEKEFDNAEFVRRFVKNCRKGGIEYAKSK